MRAKLVLGSMSPVISSTLSIWLLMRSLTRSNSPSAGHLPRPDQHPFIPSYFRSVSRAVAYSRSSGADLSAIQARVRAWRSRVSDGIECDAGSTSRKMSSMSMVVRGRVQRSRNIGDGIRTSARRSGGRLEKDDCSGFAGRDPCLVPFSARFDLHSTKWRGNGCEPRALDPRGAFRLHPRSSRAIFHFLFFYFLFPIFFFYILFFFSFLIIPPQALRARYGCNYSSVLP